MAYTENLKVYKLSYDMMIEIYKEISNFPKEYKYSLWEKIKEYTLEIVMNIYETNSIFDPEKRKQYLDKTIISAEKTKLLLRLSKDINILSLTKFASISIVIVDILRQLEWWKKSIK